MTPTARRRPLSIKLFSILCVLGAFVSLIRGLLDPFTAQGTFWGYTGQWLSEDAVIIALFSVFTIALIPIFWIYSVASPIARWIVVAFGLLSMWLYVNNPSYVIHALGHDPAEMLAPTLKLLSIALLFVPSSNRYFEQNTVRNASSA
ncbi:MAG: hypothetical protein AAF127_05210 [Pseudomonadota bacterium]